MTGSEGKAATATTNGRGWEELADGLADMARELLAEPSVQATLDAISKHAVTLVEGCEAAGVLIVKRRQVQTLSSTDAVVIASDRAQGEFGEGPCFDATVDREPVFRIEDLTSDVQRWPRYAPRAREIGVRSMMGFLLYTRDSDNLGALDMYSSQPGAFTEHSQHVGLILAAHAAVALASARHEEDMDRALESARTIGEALGIVMTRYQVGEEDALNVLIRRSQNTNTKIRDLARTIIDTGELPSG